MYNKNMLITITWIKTDKQKLFKEIDIGVDNDEK